MPREDERLADQADAVVSERRLTKARAVSRLLGLLLAAMCPRRG